MTDDLKERLLAEILSDYGPDRPDPLCEEAHAHITDLEARLAAAEAERDYWQKDSAAAWDKCEERRLQAVAAEAGEDALADGLRALWFHDAPHSALAAYEARRKG